MSVKLKFKEELEQLKKDRVVFILRTQRIDEILENADVLVEETAPPIKVRISFVHQGDDMCYLMPFVHLSGFSDVCSWCETVFGGWKKIDMKGTVLYCLNMVN